MMTLEEHKKLIQKLRNKGVVKNEKDKKSDDQIKTSPDADNVMTSDDKATEDVEIIADKGSKSCCIQ